ncbi:MAG: protein kinase domain-containing protein, partial [Acidimicrobiales bacterium]
MATSRIADSVGRVLGDRYRLARPLGTGASAHVYVAEDVSLRRRVAIKVLHPALAGDEGFLRRFRAEARVVAALRHPNILRVYDWGEDGGSPYLVMELLEGGSLRSLLDRGQLLSPAQAAAVGADAARALEYAHRRGLVHRDVKPANLIFDDEGRLTVGDFGLARALAEATWTEPSGSVVGTARYAAPEQVRGRSLDNRADVYSLALVLIEATTGMVPFAADTTIATLMARVEQPLSAPHGAGALGPVLEAAGTVEPDQRLDAAALARALDGVAAKLPPPGPLPLAPPIEAGGAEVDSDPTDYPGRPRLFDAAALADGSPPPAGASPRLGRKRRWPRRLAIIVALALLAIAGAAGGLVASGALVPSHPVPSLIGDTEAAAAGTLRPLHLRLAVAGRSYNSKFRTGTVISQQPDRGRLKEGKTVSVTVSLGPQPVPVPSLANLTVDEARSV